MVLKIALTIAEALGGWLSGSLSLLSDALHNLSDVLSIVISWFAVRMAAKKHDKNNTFGYRRATIIAAVINATLLIIMSLFLFREAYFKLIQPEKINALLVIVIAAIGIILNAVAVYLLHKSSGDDLNMRAVYLHFLFSRGDGRQHSNLLFRGLLDRSRIDGADWTVHPQGKL